MQVLDVYRPKDTEGNLPVIVSVHGGGWVYGDKELYQYYCMSIAQRGFAVVNFTYRLAPEYQFPAPMEDTNSVFAWILDNKDKYGMDVANLLQWAILPVDRFFHCMQISVRMQSMQKNMISRYRKD